MGDLSTLLRVEMPSFSRRVGDFLFGGAKTSSYEFTWHGSTFSSLRFLSCDRD